MALPAPPLVVSSFSSSWTTISSLLSCLPKNAPMFLSLVWHLGVLLSLCIGRILVPLPWNLSLYGPSLVYLFEVCVSVYHFTSLPFFLSRFLSYRLWHVLLSISYLFCLSVYMYAICLHIFLPIYTGVIFHSSLLPFDIYCYCPSSCTLYLFTFRTLPL